MCYNKDTMRERQPNKPQKERKTKMVNANEMRVNADKANEQKAQAVTDKARSFIEEKIEPAIRDRASEGLYQSDGKVPEGVNVDAVISLLKENQFAVSRNGRQLVIKW